MTKNYGEFQLFIKIYFGVFYDCNDQLAMKM